MKKIMPSYYSSGNLIVRTDSYDEKKHEKQSKPKEIRLNLWKKKVSNEKNDINNLNSMNFPTLK